MGIPFKVFFFYITKKNKKKHVGTHYHSNSVGHFYFCNNSMHFFMKKNKKNMNNVWMKKKYLIFSFNICHKDVSVFKDIFKIVPVCPNS